MACVYSNQDIRKNNYDELLASEYDVRAAEKKNIMTRVVIRLCDPRNKITNITASCNRKLETLLRTIKGMNIEEIIGECVCLCVCESERVSVCEIDK